MSARTRLTGLLAAAVVAVPVALAPAPSNAAEPRAPLPAINYGWSGWMAWGFGIRPRSQNVGSSCVSVTKVWIKEFGESGVTQLKAKFELRAHYDPGFYGLSYGTRGWFYSATFPNDAASHWWYFGARHTFQTGGDYYVRGVLTGVRPGFWRIDRQTSVNLGQVGCDNDGGISVAAPGS